MEEIRNLKVTKELFEQIRYCLSCGYVIFHQSVWNEAEPAPPEDWKPRCFSPLELDGDNKVFCENYSLKTDCENCPYQEGEIKK